ncbi:putative beta-N-hexosaminidase [Xylaria arbuscula]|nr:putative beta-N-hexosaminidase [Xylaria arbuscula]
MQKRFLLVFSGVLAASLQLLPPTQPQIHNETTPGLSLDDTSLTVYITESLASHRDTGGLTLIPPSGLEFAQVFVEDLNEGSGKSWTLKVVGEAPGNVRGIVLREIDNATSPLTYEDRTPTEEAYTLEIGNHRAVISGSGARGMWWGTRTLLQQLLASNWTTLSASHITDTPAYATRGYMLDAGRKWYAPSFLKELCTYASFFKMSEFHYHTSDNYPLNRGHNDTWDEVYSQFSLQPESEDLQGLVQRRNETLTRTDFEDLQKHCASRGITIIPEIEAPGHCLSITKWKPELALPDTKDLLNLTHPESIPTVKRVWAEFLPWFQSKEVHIGADEYDSSLADDYIAFVNEMSEYINSTSGNQKRVRIWGTYEPSITLAIDTSVIIQHWQYGQSDPVALHAAGYEILNTEDWWAYMSIKNDHMPILPAPYPQFFNETRILNFGGVEGWQWEPSLFNPVNVSLQLPVGKGSGGNKGAILAAWNDNGPDASTQLEAYYAIRRGIPLVAARAWSGTRPAKVDAGSIDESIEFLAAKAPGQNLDRRIPTEGIISRKPSDELISWTRSSGENDMINLGYGSKGMNYTIELSVTGPFTLKSDDVTLRLEEKGSLVFVADGWEYPLRSVAEGGGFDVGLPGRIWVNDTSSTHTPIALTIPTTPSNTPANITITGDPIGGSRVYINGLFAGRFEVFVFGGKNTLFSWSQMAFVAPVDSLAGGVERLALWEGVHVPGGNNTSSGGGGGSGGSGGVGPVTAGAVSGYEGVGYGGMMGLLSTAMFLDFAFSWDWVI